MERCAWNWRSCDSDCLSGRHDNSIQENSVQPSHQAVLDVWRSVGSRKLYDGFPLNSRGTHNVGDMDGRDFNILVHAGSRRMGQLQSPGCILQCGRGQRNMADSWNASKLAYQLRSEHAEMSTSDSRVAESENQWSTAGE